MDILRFRFPSSEITELELEENGTPREERFADDMASDDLPEDDMAMDEMSANEMASDDISDVF